MSDELHPLKAYLLAPLAPRESAAVQSWQMDGVERVAVDVATVWDATLNVGDDSILPGTWIVAIWDDYDERYWLISANSEPEEASELPVPEGLILDGGGADSMATTIYDGGSAFSEPFVIVNGGEA